MENEIEMTNAIETTDLVEYFEALVDGLKAGKIVIEKDNEFISLTPSSVVQLEIKAKQKKDKEKLSIELSWKKTDETKKAIQNFKISSSEPENATEEQ